MGIDFDFIYAPLDIEKFKEIEISEKKDNQVVYIGRDSFEKGIDILREIAPKIKGKVVFCTNLEWKDAMKKTYRITITCHSIKNGKYSTSHQRGILS